MYRVAVVMALVLATACTPTAAPKAEPDTATLKRIGDLEAQVVRLVDSADAAHTRAVRAAQDVERVRKGVDDLRRRLATMERDVDDESAEVAAAVRALSKSVQLLSEEVASASSPSPAEQFANISGASSCMVSGGDWSEPLQVCIE